MNSKARGAGIKALKSMTTVDLMLIIEINMTEIDMIIIEINMTITSIIKL